MKILIGNLRDAAACNNLSQNFSVIEKLDDEACLKITGRIILNYFLKPRF